MNISKTVCEMGKLKITFDFIFSSASFGIVKKKKKNVQDVPKVKIQGFTLDF